MRIVLVLVVLFLAGCQAWYKPDTTLEQAVQDYRECAYDASKSTAGAPAEGWIRMARTENLCNQCMAMRGYFCIPKEKVPSTCRIVSMNGIWIAGE